MHYAIPCHWTLLRRKSEQAQSSWGIRSKDLQIFIDRTFRAGVPNLLFPIYPLSIPTHEHVPLQHFDRWTIRRVARNFDRGGQTRTKSPTFKYIMPFVFKAPSIKCAYFWYCFFWIILFWFKPANRKFAFIDLTCFKSLFLVNFQVPTLNESHHVLVKLPYEEFVKILMLHKRKIYSMHFSANIAVEQRVIVVVIMIALLIFTRFWCTPPHVQSKPSSDFALRHGLPKY